MKYIDELGSIFTRSHDSRVLNLKDQYTLRAIMKGEPSEEELRIINRLMHAVRRNWIEMSENVNGSTGDQSLMGI
ncbi:MAG: hypothetical protein AB4352_17985 [Hormoscilla sp.]